ncbi:MAG: tRNA 2-thiouridine(34) synthase MnmA, partial [Chlorobi bacterium]|nr:tRNA 2-thiouridine(34) synthase MnmA [Chlorobiota bacterium]
MTDQFNKRVVVGMSGGVDSSVAAALLVEQGYDVIGITIKTHNYEDAGAVPHNPHSCCSLEGINDARAVCMRLGIPHYVVDFSRRFNREVIDRFTEEYLEGRTPNPCVLCNREIKWDALYAKAVSLGASFIAMGHYARVEKDTRTGRHFVRKGVDDEKDQSYALWNVKEEHLAATLLPLGGLTKEEVRREAERFGLLTAGKGESFEICFIPDDDYRRFLRERVAGLAESVSGGDILFEGKRVGVHDGYPFYTIGQRRGLNIAVGEPVYVTEIRADENVVVVGRAEELLRRACIAREVNWQKWPGLAEARRVVARIRYKD